MKTAFPPRRLVLAVMLAWQAGPVASAAPERFVHLRDAPPPLQISLRAAEGANPEIEALLNRPANLWERIRRGFAIPDLDHRLVEQHQAWYAARPDLVGAIVQRARRYLHFIVDEVERRGLPTELALLPFVESGYNPMALSSAQASGLWQFIPGTGSKYRLVQNAQYDARRDVAASTAAALDYLQFLHDFNERDWHRALASYNWGEAAVARAVERNRARGLGDAFAHLSLPDETRNYVPRLQAIKNIVRDPAAFGIDLGELPNEPSLAVVHVTQEIDIKRAAALAEMPLDEFLLLNPAFNGSLVPGAHDVRLLIPLGKVEAFHVNLQRYRGTTGKRVTIPARPGPSRKLHIQP